MVIPCIQVYYPIFSKLTEGKWTIQGHRISEKLSATRTIPGT